MSGCPCSGHPTSGGCQDKSRKETSVAVSNEDKQYLLDEMKSLELPTIKSTLAHILECRRQKIV